MRRGKRDRTRMGSNEGPSWSSRHRPSVVGVGRALVERGSFSQISRRGGVQPFRPARRTRPMPSRRPPRRSGERSSKRTAGSWFASASRQHCGPGNIGPRRPPDSWRILRGVSVLGGKDAARGFSRPSRRSRIVCEAGARWRAVQRQTEAAGPAREPAPGRNPEFRT